MTGEINILPLPQAPAPGPSRPQPISGELLKLVPPLEGLIAAGQSAKAEVLSLKQTDQTFQLLLKVTLESGRQTTVQATSTQPLPQGTSLAVTQPSASNLAITVQQAIASSVATLTRIDTAQMPVGTLLQGKVLTNQALPQTPGQPAAYRALVSLLNSAQAGATLSIDSPRPLAIGSLLSALVQGDQSLRFVPLSGRQDQLSIAQQLLTQQNRQASLPGLLNTLQQLTRDPGVDGELRASAERLLAGLPDARQLGDAKAVAQALNNSGSFLEAKLLSGSTASVDTDRGSCRARRGLGAPA